MPTVIHLAPDPLTLGLLSACCALTLVGLCVLVFVALKKSDAGVPVKKENTANTTAANATATMTDPNLPIVIAAAINQLLDGKNYRVVRIRPIDNPTWVEQGRCDIFQSRNTL